MIKVRNKKAIRNLADKSYKANKTRNLIAIIAIALTSLLFTTLYTMGLATVDNMQRAMMRQSGGDGHAVLKNINEEVFIKIKQHPLIKEIAYRRILCDGVLNKEFLKRQTEFWYYDDAALKLGFIKLDGGHRPIAENEVIVDTHTLQLMGVPLKIGAPLTLKLNIRGEEVRRDFVLSGWWKSDPLFNVGQIYASKAYLTAYATELQNTHKENHFYTGTINPYIMFDDSLNLRSKLDQVIVESGYSLDKEAENYVESNVNWAYLSTNFIMSPGIIVALISGLLLIVLTGYLIIYNIFQISVMRDIRFYGLLKTIGTSGGQIRRIIRRQALLLSTVGIPIGLIIGYMVGKSLVPLIMKNTKAASIEISVSPSPWIFILAALFAIMTVSISIYKPSRTASKVSPVEAIRYVDRDLKNKVMLKKTTQGVNMHSMARTNLGRNKKRTILVVTSLSLSLVLLNTTFALSQSMDMDKYLSSRFSDTDFLIGHADLFRQNFEGLESETSGSIIRAVQSQPGFEGGGRLYGDPQLLTVEKPKNTTIETSDRLDAYNNYTAQVYGLEELPLHQLQLIDGELDYGLLTSGKYILEGVELNDNGKPKSDWIKYKVGDKITLHSYMGTKEAPMDKEYTTHKFIILGHAAIKNSNSDRRLRDYNFYLPADIYKRLTPHPIVMSYAFNVSSDKETTMETFLKSYTKIVEPLMDYQSKFTVENEVSDMRKTVSLIGGTLSLIIGLIGILNFFNAILTSILTRRQEFAMLQSIGMTKKQLRSMLAFEGLYYTVCTSVFSILLAIMSSLFIVKPISSMIWFFSYHFVIWPVLVILPLLFALGVIIPLVIYFLNNKQSIVEQLRQAE
ncbi:ABC transporter permease [Paenibacillus polymyxa]|uniref:ABC transporter permease n=1 Tax=Paenibacillus polymyxa TaxID=1406 RepID=UPI0004D3D4E7|nr:ABC transporter permease [Paenibacillus polymyxa]KEO77119.1 ABC transporter permease [Paenibacillus polymyxa]MCH6189038.1 ABC transporter permease [Paenibacillus polymyxa]MDY8095772.1 ABC transporter permease [Paenibacillus polymyxa]WRL57863.1 ABC transporter permease [Paenibacillus polymyxa]